MPRSGLCSTNITQTIKYYIQKKGRGFVFTPNDFINIGHRNTVGKLLSRLSERGDIRSIGWGLYDYPRIDKDSNKYLDPELHSIIRAIEIQYGDKLQYGGEYSLYLLGIHDEKPKNIIYLGNTRAKRIRVFTHDIIIKPTKIPVTKNKNDPHILAIQSLIYIGRKNISHCVATWN